MESLENLPSRIYSSWISVFLLAAVLGLLYRHFTVTFDHFHKLGVPFMKPVIILGNPVTKSVILATKSIFDYHVITYNHFKGFRMGGIFEGRRPMLMIRDPELVKAVLVKDFDHFTDKLDYKLNTIIQVKKMLLYLTGNEWKSVRSIITPSFSSAKLRSMEPLIEQCCVQMTDFLKQRAANDTEVEMKFFACRYTLDVIGSCAFGLDCASLKCPDAKFVKMADDFMEIPTLHRIFFFSVMMLCPSYIPYIPVNMFNEEAVHYLRDVIIKTMKDRENNPSFRREDFVQLMLDTSKKEKSESGENVLTDVIIQAQAMIFFMAGFETSSALLSFACATLALLPDIQDRLRKDIQEAIENGKGRSYFEIINEIPLLEQVLLETMRMYPSVPRLERVCTKPYTIPGSDVKLNLGDIILIPVAGIMNNPKYYPNPEVFNPGRFSEAKKTKPTEVYLPFGVGPRHCLGMRFAMLTTKIYMFYLLKEFKLNPSEKTQLPFAFHKKSYLLKAEKGLWVNVVPLDKC